VAVHATERQPDRGVGFGEREERLVPQPPENVGLGDSHARFDLGLVARAIRTRRQNADAVMRRHHGVAAIDLGIVERSLVHAALEIVGHDETRHAAEEAEHAHMRLDPVRQRLRPGRFGVGVIRGAQHCDEDLGVAHLAGRRIDDGDLLAGVVDEHLVAGDVVLAHHRRQASLELTIEIAESRVAVAVRMSFAVLLPQHHQVDARPLELARQRRPVRFAVPAPARPDATAGEQPLLENLVAPLGRQRPIDPGRPRSLEIVLDRAARHPERAPDRSCAHAVVVQPQHLPQLPHGQLSSGRHQIPPR
jgi:hypothetical protein